MSSAPQITIHIRHDETDLDFRVRASTKWSKVLKTFTSKTGKKADDVRFTRSDNGQVIPTTPDLPVTELGIKDGDELTVEEIQVGGGRPATAALPYLRTLRAPDAVQAFATGEFLERDRHDLVLARGDALELHTLDPESLTLACRGTYALHAAPLAVHAFPLRDVRSSVFDDLDVEDDGGDDADAMPVDGEAVHPLRAAKWAGADILAVTTTRAAVEFFAATWDRDGGGSGVVFHALKEISLPGRPLAFDHRELGAHLAVHRGTRDVAVAAFQDVVRVHSLASVAAFTSPDDSSLLPSEYANLDPLLGPVVIWNTFFLEPHPVLGTYHLVVLGYRDLTKQVVAFLVERNAATTPTAAADAFAQPPNFRCASLPLDVSTFPSLAASFPLPYKHDAFALVMGAELLVISAWDVQNGNVAGLARRRLPCAGLVSGWCTVPDRVSEYFYLVSDQGEVMKAAGNVNARGVASVGGVEMVKRVPNVLDAQLAHLGRDELDGVMVDVVLAMSPRSDWQILLIGTGVFHQVEAAPVIAPVLHAVRMPLPPTGSPSAAALATTKRPLVLAAANQLVEVYERIPFVVESAAETGLEGLVSVHVADAAIVLSFSFQTVVLHYAAGEIDDISESSAWDCTASTLAVVSTADHHLQVLAHRIVAIPRAAADTDDSATAPPPTYVPPEGSHILHAAPVVTDDSSPTASSGLALALHLASGEYSVLLLTPALTLDPAFPAPLPFTSAPTCLAATRAAVWVATHAHQVVQYPGGVSADLPDAATANAMHAHPATGAVVVGLRNGAWCTLDPATGVVATHARALGLGPVGLVPAKEGDGVWAFCDGGVYVVRAKRRDASMHAHRVDVPDGDGGGKVVAVAGFQGMVLVVSDAGRLTFGRFAEGEAGVVVKKYPDTGARNFIPRKLLATAHGPTPALLACGSERSASVIRVLDAATMRTVSQLALPEYLAAWCEWPMAAARPKLLVGTATVAPRGDGVGQGTVAGGHFYVYQFKRGTNEIAADAYKSPPFTAPVRAVVAMTKTVFAAGIGKSVALHAFDTVAKTVVAATTLALRSSITCLAASSHSGNDWLAIGTVRDSIVLARLTGTGAAAGLEVVASDAFARHITHAAWTGGGGTVVVAADRAGVVVGLRHDPDSETSTLTTTFLVNLGHPLSALLPPASPDEGDDRVTAVSVSGAVHTVGRVGDARTAAELHEAHESLATRAYRAYRAPLAAGDLSSVVDLGLVAQYRGERKEQVKEAVRDLNEDETTGAGRFE
ncbi:SUMO protein smt3 [Blastocladiella emersonii ATCC 22665]|nr:SUMO protein smt3 [Blastocladiella emersonii ATCC 22665]